MCLLAVGVVSDLMYGAGVGLELATGNGQTC